MKVQMLKKSLEAYGQPIVLFGAALLGEVALKTLEGIGLQPACFCDNSPLKQGNRFLGYAVISPEALKRDYVNPYVIVCSIRYGGICKQLCSLNITPHDARNIFKNVDYHCAYSEPENAVKQEIERYLQIIKVSRASDKLYIENLDLAITEKCSLRCKDCMNLSTYYRVPKDADTELLLESFGRLTDCIDGVFVVNVHGGEPFMNKDMHIIIDNLINNRTIMKIVVISNGTMVPLGKNLACLKHKKICVAIDDYKGLSRKIPKLVEIFTREGINYKLIRMDEWLDYGGLEYRSRNKENLLDIFAKCRKCFTLLNGKLFICGRSAHGMNTGVFADEPNDYVDLINDKLSNSGLRKEIYKLLYRTENITACNYCNAFNLECAKMIKAAVQENSADFNR